MLFRNFLLTILFVFSFFKVVAQESYDGVSGSTKHTKLPEVFTIAINKTSYPYHFQGDNGQAEGLTVDLWKLWAKKQNVQVEFKVLTWEETLAQVISGEVDIHAGLSANEDREKLMFFLTPFFDQNNYVFIHRDFRHINSMQEVQTLTLGVVKGSSHNEVLKRNFPYLTIKPFENRFAMYQAALNGEIAAFTHLDKLSYNYPRHKELHQLFPPYQRLMFYKSEYGSAISKETDRNLIAYIEEGFKKISTEEKSVIEKHWLGFDKKTDTLTLLYSPFFPPFMSESVNGQAQGLFIDIWKKWSENTGLAVEFVPQSYKTAYEMIDSDGADVLIAHPNNDNLDETLHIANEMYRVRSNVYVRTQAGKYTQLAQLKGHKVGYFTVANHQPKIKNVYPEIDFVPFSDFKIMIDSAAQGEVDAVIGPTEIIDALLIKGDLQPAFYKLEHLQFLTDIVSVTNSKNKKLAELIKSGFSLIPQEELIDLERRWLSNNSDGYFYLKSKHVTLTDNEDQWLTAHPKITIGINRQWAPVEFIDVQGQIKGINADINLLVEQRTGIKFTYKEYDNWSDMFGALMKGAC